MYLHAIFRYDRKTSKFVCTHVNLNHVNHEISNELYSMYPDRRRPTGSAAEEADNMLKVRNNRLCITLNICFIVQSIDVTVNNCTHI